MARRLRRVPFGNTARFLIRDRDENYPDLFDQVRAVDDLEWAAATVVTAALRPPVGQLSFDGSLFASGSDRAAASAAPHLLQPAFTETSSEAEEARSRAPCLPPPRMTRDRCSPSSRV
jgi:hypothetical protein